MTEKQPQQQYAIGKEEKYFTQRIEVVPSILSADFTNLGKEIKKVERAGCSRLHLDVMDGHFVPNISIGPVVIKAIRKYTDLYLQTHLMIDHPERYVADFKRAGSDCIIIHQEACRNFRKTVEMIKGLKMKVGISLRPKTPLDTIKDIIDKVDMILIMTVEPGFGGQTFIRESEKKVAAVKTMLYQKGLNINIGVDGGINNNTIPLVVKAGATYLIAGSAVFKGDVTKNIRDLRERAKETQYEGTRRRKQR
jgi:ribulose-phosphate 3-epimerase